MYKNYLLALLSGFLLAFSWPTYGVSLLVFMGFTPLLIAEYQIRKSNNKYKKSHVFFSAYLGFLVWNSITTWWIWNSTPEGAIFALVVNSLLMTSVFLMYHLIALRKPQRFANIFLVTIWIAFEKFHLNWEFSWPWLNLGNVFSDNPQWIQWYEYTGVFGGTLWIWIVNLNVFYAIRQYTTTLDIKTSVRQLLLPVSLVVIGLFLSLYQYYSYEEKGTSITALLLQPNINPYTEKYQQTSDEIATDLIELCGDEIDDSVQFILGPETVLSQAMTLPQFKSSKAYKQFSDFNRQYKNSGFLLGIDLYKTFRSNTAPTPTANKFRNSKNAWYESYNAAVFLSYNASPQIYHKSKLVVGVEHFPYRNLLAPLLGDIMIEHGSSVNVLTPQKGAKVFTHPNSKIKAAPIICYESIYGEFVTKYVLKGGEFLAIITNDSWWGNTQGHQQLLSYARLRAIENRRSVARSANSGISAFINQRGDILEHLDYETKGILKGSIKPNSKLTFYTKHGDYIARISIFTAFLFGLIGFFRKKRTV